MDRCSILIAQLAVTLLGKEVRRPKECKDVCPAATQEKDSQKLRLQRVSRDTVTATGAVYLEC